MRQWKMKVTPEQSEAVQKKVFTDGGEWKINGKEVSNIDSVYLFFDGKLLTYSKTKETFEEKERPEITYEEFMEVVMET